MPETAAKPAESAKVNPADNLQEWLEKKDAEPAAKPVEAKPDSPAEPEVPEAPAQAQPVVDWREVVLPDDVDHGFFRGKKVPQVIESYRHSERAKQDAERRVADLERRLAELQRPAEPAKPASIEPNTWFEKPDEALARIREEAKTAVREEWTKFRQQDQAERYQEAVLTTGSAAYDKAREELKLDEQTWKLRAPAIMLHLTDQNSPYFGDGQGLFDPSRYVEVSDVLWPRNAAPVVIKEVPEPPPPPGAKKPAAAQTGQPQSSPLSKEQREAWTVAAQAAGLDPERFLKRAK